MKSMIRAGVCPEPGCGTQILVSERTGLIRRHSPRGVVAGSVWCPTSATPYEQIDQIKQAEEDIEQQALRVLTDHSLLPGVRDGRVHCRCHWGAARGSAPDFYAPHQKHQIAELARAGLLVNRKQQADDRATRAGGAG